MNRRLFLGLLPLIANAGPPQRRRDLRLEIPLWMQYGSVPGAWVTVIERGKIAWAQGFGVRNAETKQPVDAQTIFEAASLTKQVTAYVAHSLVKEGKLDLNKPLHDYVPGVLTDPVSKTVTARHVLSHGSGWPNWRGQKGEALVPQWSPGSSFRYSGEGYVFLSRVLEKVADAGLMELVQKRVFDPLGMSGSSMVRRLDRADRMAAGHNGKGEVRDGTIHLKFWELVAKANPPKPALSWRYEDVESAMPEPRLPNMMVPNAAASMCTTGPDYAKFLLNAIKNPLLRERVSTIREGDGWSLGWGLGWGVEQVAGRRFLWQWGDNGGYKAFVMMDPVAESGVFVFTNGNNGQRLCDRIVTHATGVEHPAILWLS